MLLLELKSAAITTGGLVDALLSHGLDWSLDHPLLPWRGLCQQAGRLRAADDDLAGGSFGRAAELIAGGLQRRPPPDLVVRRSDTQWNIFFSTNRRSLVHRATGPDFRGCRAHGYLEIQDLNGDGLSDIIWHEVGQAQPFHFHVATARQRQEPMSETTARTGFGRTSPSDLAASWPWTTCSLAGGSGPYGRVSRTERSGQEHHPVHDPAAGAAQQRAHQPLRVDMWKDYKKAIRSVGITVETPAFYEGLVLLSKSLELAALCSTMRPRGRSTKSGN